MNKLLFAGLSAVVLAGITTPVMIAADRTPLPSAAASLAAKPEILLSGNFMTVEQDHATMGTARIVEEAGQRYLEFDNAFDTARGPAVKVVLHKNATVPVNLTEGDYLVLADLQRFEGAQRYMIPASVSLNDYESVAIWCAEFNVTFGYAHLRH